MISQDKKLVFIINEMINEKIYSVDFLLGYLSCYVVYVDGISGNCYSELKNHIIYFDGKHEIDEKFFD